MLDVTRRFAKPGMSASGGWAEACEGYIKSGIAKWMKGESD